MTLTKMKLTPLTLLIFGFILVLSINPTSAHNKYQEFIAANEQLEDDTSSLLTYIVHVNKPALQSKESLHGWYHSLLPDTTKTQNQKRVIFSYRNIVDGFAVKLTAEEAKALEAKEEVLSTRPEKIFSLHTTHTPSFLGLQQNQELWQNSNLGKGIIIGVLDTGIYPLHPSFSDEGMSSPPAKWNGHCEFTGKRICNNKLIGARNFVNSSLPFDDVGHGTHTSSTAAGRSVKGANVFGNANGIATGMAPDAHLAMYKVCGIYGCAESTILAGMDAAVDDGVDVLSLSLGGPSGPLFEEGIALGAFSAIQKGIFVSCSAANSGPAYGTLSNEAPWILTVGASTTDRKIEAIAKLGNGKEYLGESVFQPKDFASTLLPLVYAGSLNTSDDFIAFCDPFSMMNVDVKGKVVLCEQGGLVKRVVKGQAVKDAGGAAMILVNSELEAFNPIADVHVLPAVHVSYSAGLSIKDYINSTSTPIATIIFKGTVIGNPLAPQVASFSSRGPSKSSPGILKPDIIGPGLNILAAWPISLDNSTIPSFNIISGTSMSCPHLSGIAALLKNSHPDWSPAAIKSAIMTTANTLNLHEKPILDQRLKPADLFAVGAGHVNPLKANDPGLVYDIEANDYVPYLCGLNYTDRQVGVILQQKVKCSEVKSIPQAQLNYPSFSIILGSSSQFYTRTLTNVGPVNTTYNVVIDAPLAVGISIGPSQITFTEVKQKVTYSVDFVPEDKKIRGDNMFAQGSIKWVSGKYSVSIPISVIFV